MDIKLLLLHDASLREVRFDWKERKAVFVISIVKDETIGSEEISISFKACEELNIPSKFPWGESVSINTYVRSAKEHCFEMQSGDKIRIIADHCEAKENAL